MKVTVVKRKYPQYAGELSELAVRRNLDCIMIRTVNRSLKIIRQQGLRQTLLRQSVTLLAFLTLLFGMLLYMRRHIREV